MRSQAFAVTGEPEAETNHGVDWEAEIIVASQRDARAFAPLYRHYAPLVLRYCQRSLGHAAAADDATSQVFIKALAALPRFEPRSGQPRQTFRSWLFTIAHNVIVDLQRRNRGHLSIDDEPTRMWLATGRFLIDHGPTPEAAAIANETRLRVRAMLDALPERQRHIIELRLIGLSGVEIAAVLGMTHGAVKAAQARAYAPLRHLLAPDDSGARS